MAKFKQKIIDALLERGVFMQPKNDHWWRTRCPYCGDSVRENTGHFYIRINPDDNTAMGYKCFKCEESGYLNREVLEELGVTEERILGNIQNFNRQSDKVDNKNYTGENQSKVFDYEIPEIEFGSKTDYINDRLGRVFTEEEFKDMKAVTSLLQFIRLNGIKDKPFHDSILWTLEKDYIGFLSYGNSHILFRDTTGKHDMRWVKYPITKQSVGNRLFYCMSGSVDVFGREPITINLAEGVLDTVSACYNLGYGTSNTLNCAVTGKYYYQMLIFLLDKGICGSNVHVNLFSDNDEVFNKKNGKVVKSTTLEYYEKLLENIKHLYGSITVYYNKIDKDIGVPRDKISLEKHIL